MSRPASGAPIPSAFAQRLPGRASVEQIRRMARSPSHYAPRARDFRQPRPAVLPWPGRVEQGYTSAIHANPTDPRPREFYRDWLTIRGDARSLGFAGVPMPVAAATAWEDCLSAWGARDLAFANGWPVGVSLSGRSFISLGEKLLAAVPIQRVRLVAIQCFMDELASCEHLAQLIELNLGGNQIGDAGAAWLARADLRNLKHLDLRGNSIGDAGWQRLEAATWFGQLEVCLRDPQPIRTIAADPRCAA